MVRVRGGGTHRQKLETPRRKQHTTTRGEHETAAVSVEGYINIEHERRPLRQSSELEKDRVVNGDHEPDSGDDCSVEGDDDCDAVNDEEADDGLGIEEDGNLEDDFRETPRDEEVESNIDSGDDIWDDERIHDALSSSDEDEEEAEQELRENEDAEELLTLGKTYNSTKDFKISILKYSLKTRYDAKFYRSQAMKVGAKCADTDVECPWRVYCSYEKRRHKMQIKVYVNNHICIRSRRSKMLKRSTIAWLFSERLRVNPRLTKEEMVYEIKRGYNLEVTGDQCGKEKSKGLVKAVHTILPHAEHRQCARHIMDNWKRDSHDQELQRMFWKIARSYTIGEYTDNSEALKRFIFMLITLCEKPILNHGKKEKVEAYVNEYYTTKKWRETYKDGIKPVQGMVLWPRLNRLAVLPPPWRRGNPGRPSNYARRKGRNESGSSKTTLTRQKRVITCSNCKEDGHNKQGCPNPSVESPPKRPRGRPRKQGGVSQPQQGSQTQRQSQRQGVSQELGSQG
ncbi:hypothetical protein HA466_0166960 [Hirschfeldia incana]|nr:hypothetical protein HA466_0166960 [Hirschfeldia incana]